MVILDFRSSPHRQPFSLPRSILILQHQPSHSSSLQLFLGFPLPHFSLESAWLEHAQHVWRPPTFLKRCEARPCSKCYKMFADLSYLLFLLCKCCGCLQEYTPLPHMDGTSSLAFALPLKEFSFKCAQFPIHEWMAVKNPPSEPLTFSCSSQEMVLFPGSLL